MAELKKQSQFKGNRQAQLKVKGKMPSALAGGTPATQNKANSKPIRTELPVRLEQGDDVFDWGVGLDVVGGAEDVAAATG
jgi:hypothetical protein